MAVAVRMAGREPFWDPPRGEGDGRESEGVCGGGRCPGLEAPG